MNLDRRAGEKAWEVGQKKKDEYNRGYRLGIGEGEYGGRGYYEEESEGFKKGYGEGEENREFDRDEEW